MEALEDVMVKGGVGGNDQDEMEEEGRGTRGGLLALEATWLLT